MRSPQLVTFALRARLALARRGGLGLVAGALFAAAAAGSVALVRQRDAQEQAHESALRAAHRHSREPVVASDTLPVAPRHLREFHAALGDVHRTDDALKTIFAAGERSRLVLDQADYKLAYDKGGRFWTYAVQLPVSGSYAAIRAFSEQVLLALPYASLDEIDFHRKDIAQPTLDARLRFTLHLEGPAEGAAR